jgi:hypothetical protein
VNHLADLKIFDSGLELIRCETSPEPHQPVDELPDAAVPRRAIDNARMRCTFASQSEEVAVQSNDDALLSKGKCQVLLIRSPNQSGLLSGRDIDAPEPQAVGHGAVDVLIEMKADLH